MFGGVRELQKSTANLDPAVGTKKCVKNRVSVAASEGTRNRLFSRGLGFYLSNLLGNTFVVAERPPAGLLVAEALLRTSFAKEGSLTTALAIVLHCLLVY